MSAADMGGLPTEADVAAAAMPGTGEGCLTCPAPLPATAPAEKPADNGQCLRPAGKQCTGLLCGPVS